LEAAAQKFEQEDGILEVVQAQPLLGDDSLQLTLFACTEDDGYRPYCKIEFEEGTAIWEQVKGNAQDLNYISQREFLRSVAQESVSSGGSTLSSQGPDERLLQNVGFLFWLHFCYHFDVKSR